MTKKLSQSEVNNIVWKACDTFRGVLDPSQYKDFVLTMLFVKYVSDVWKEKKREYIEKGARQNFAVHKTIRFEVTDLNYCLELLYYTNTRVSILVDEQVRISPAM